MIAVKVILTSCGILNNKLFYCTLELVPLLVLVLAPKYMVVLNRVATYISDLFL